MMLSNGSIESLIMSSVAMGSSSMKGLCISFGMLFVPPTGPPKRLGRVVESSEFLIGYLVRCVRFYAIMNAYWLTNFSGLSGVCSREPARAIPFTVVEVLSWTAGRCEGLLAMRLIARHLRTLDLLLFSLFLPLETVLMVLFVSWELSKTTTSMLESYVVSEV